MNTLERLIARCEPAAGGCVVFTGCHNSRGYGVISVAGERKLAHRVAYEGFVGPIPDGMTVDHLCKTKLCVNTAHMEIVSREVNTLRGGRVPRQTPRCAAGHARVGGNGAAVAPECTRCAKQAAHLAEYAALDAWLAGQQQQAAS